MSRPSNANYDTNSTIHEQWIQVLCARRGASAAQLLCPYCYDPPTFTNEHDLWLHVKTYHAVHMPKNDKLATKVNLAVKLFREEVLAKSRSTSKKKPSENTSHEDGKLGPTTAVSLMPCTASSPLRASRLENLHSGPCSQIFISCVRSTPGKRLFDPSETTSSQSMYATSNTSTRPVQQIRKCLSCPQYAASTHIEKPSSLTGGKTQDNLLPSPISNHSKITSQFKAGPISQEQRVAEVKGIYASLVVVERKCIQVDLKQAQLAKEAPLGTQPKWNNEQYQALIALHRTLLHEHHDFFSVSQHPSAILAVRRLAVKYDMPARLWRHAIHSFLKLLQNKLPASLDYMLAFIYLAYSMMTLLLETVPAFEDTWIECLGDLSRYRMAIEDDNFTKQIWAQVARQWYLKSANRSPTTGRLYYRLAILAQPDALPQLMYYGKSLAIPIPFAGARESIMTLFEPMLNPNHSKRRFAAAFIAIVRCHAIVFTRQSLDTFDETLDNITSHLNEHIARITKKYLEQGYYIAISNCIALLGYGADDNPLSVLMKPPPSDQDTIILDTNATSSPGPELLTTFTAALRLFNQTTTIHLLRIGDTNTLSFLHVTLVFLRHVARHPRAVELLFPTFPWKQLMLALNAITVLHPPNIATIESPNLPEPDSPHPATRIETTPDAPAPPTLPLNPAQLDIAGKHDTVASAPDIFRPFPEEWAMQGLLWTRDYHPDGWFANENVESESHYLEAESMNSHHRPERVLWLGVQLDRLGGGEWLKYGEGACMFSIGPKGADCHASANESESDSEVEEGERDRGNGSQSSSESSTLKFDDKED